MIENHVYSDYESLKHKTSLINGRKIVDRRVFTCPRCTYEQEPLPHSEWISCPKCHLMMRRAGNSLELVVGRE